VFRWPTEAVLERDGYRCRVCDASGWDKRSITVHHRVPGKSVMSLMRSLCPGCHAKVHRTKAVLSAMQPATGPVPLFIDEREGSDEGGENAPPRGGLPLVTAILGLPLVQGVRALLMKCSLLSPTSFR